MKRILVLAIAVMSIWAVAQGAYVEVDLYDFTSPGSYSPSTGWLSVTNTYYLPAGCWYDTTAAKDSMIDTTYTLWKYLGTGDMEYLITKYQVTQLDTFGNADLRDTVGVALEFCLDPVSQPTMLWRYVFTKISAVQAAPESKTFILSDSLQVYQYPYARLRIIYNTVYDSTYASWTTGCAAEDNIKTHLSPIIVKEWYRPIWR